MHTIRHEHGGQWSATARPTFPGFFRWSITAAVGQVFQTLLIWQEHASERHALASLDDRMLRDVGLSRADIEVEANKPFWRA